MERCHDFYRSPLSPSVGTQWIATQGLLDLFTPPSRRTVANFLGQPIHQDIFYGDSACCHRSKPEDASLSIEHLPMSNLAHKRLFIVWKVYQRRAESIAQHLDCKVVYFHYSWEERSKLWKAASYVVKALATSACLLRDRPQEVIVQLPPVPVLYVVWIYAFVFRKKFIADCHNAMIDGHWANWPLARRGLSRAKGVFVHNEDVYTRAKNFGLQNVYTARDPLPERIRPNNVDELAKLGLTQGAYVIVPWNFAADEPVEALAEAACLLPSVQFIATWFAERLSPSIRSSMPPNVIFTGYLPVDAFNAVFANAGAALSLTIREGTQPSAASEAIAFNVPLVLSDMETARRLYGDNVIRVTNEAREIARGVTEAIQNNAMWKRRIAELRETLNASLAADIARIQSVLAGNDGKV